jgi:hypothetical protein
VKALVSAQVLAPVSGKVEVLVLVWDMELDLAQVLVQESALVRESVQGSESVPVQVSVTELVQVQGLA